MKKRMKLFGIAVAVLMALAVGAGAEEPKIGNMTLSELKSALGMSIYLQGGYTYNFEDPQSQVNDFRIFDHEANSFTLDLAQLIFAKDAPVNGVGYKLKVSAGETAKFIHSAGLGNPDESFDLTEAYISYVAPIGKGLNFAFGKMVTYMGSEVIEAKDDQNYSRSFLFNYAIPFTQTGLKAGYTFNDMLGANLYVVNGWDNSDDNNNGKSFGASISFTPVEKVSMLFNTMYGPEQNGDTADNRFIFDWVGIIKPMKNLMLNLNADYGTEKNALPTGDATWQGIAGIAKYDFSEMYSIAVRAEYFDDKDGFRTGTAQKLKEVTITPQVQLAENFLMRPEYRHDWSDKDVFDSNTSDSQDTLSFSVMYTW
jgi:hypothetical protein